MRALALASLAVLAATPLAAETCAPFTAEDGYYAAVESSELHAILVGDLEPLGPPNPDGEVTAIFSGEEMSAGWAPLTTEITVRAVCDNGVCEKVPAMTDAVLYPIVDEATNTFTLPLTACPLWAFDAVDPLMLSLVETAYKAPQEDSGAAGDPIDGTDGGPTDHEGQGADAP